MAPISLLMQSIKRQAMLPCLLMLSYADEVVSRQIVMKYAMSYMLCVVVSPATPVFYASSLIGLCEFRGFRA